MTEATIKVSSWLTEFKHHWLPENIPNDINLCHSIRNKINELEQLLFENNELSCITVSNDQSISESVQQIFNEPEHNLLDSASPIQLSVNIQDDDNKTNCFSRPIIRLKRISSVDAQRYLPLAWKINKSKTKKKLRKSTSSCKKSTRTKKILSIQSQDENENQIKIQRKSTRIEKKVTESSFTSSINMESNINEKKKAKRKLRAIDAEDDDLYTIGHLSEMANLNGNVDCEQIPRYIGQNGILSQTRKNNETIINNNDDNDFTIQLSLRKSNRNEMSKNTVSLNNSNGTSSSKNLSESLIGDDLCLTDDVGPNDIDDQMLNSVFDNIDNDTLFTSLNITDDRTFQTNTISHNHSVINYADCIEDITNDGIDPPSTPAPTLPHLSITT